jgi:eukaryotic-like serine/threonine-protein kinase
MATAPAITPRSVGRYQLHGVLATGGMATVHVGRLAGGVGFARTVAIKRLHPQYAADPEFVSMFTDEARLAGRIRHPNVVSVTDVIIDGDEVLMIMDYVPGETLGRLIRASLTRGERVPPRIAAAIIYEVLAGLHAAHETHDEHGAPLHIVHRDVSPQNILVGVDGCARLLDFGVAKAATRTQVTRDGQLKGKLPYMSPEQLGGMPVTATSDLFATAVVFWETLTSQRLFISDTVGGTVGKILNQPIPPPSSVEGTPDTYDAVIMKALARDPGDRYVSARDMNIALAACGPRADAHEIAAWVEHVANDSLTQQRKLVTNVEVGPASQPDWGGDTIVETPLFRRRNIVASVLLVVAAGTTMVLVSQRAPRVATPVSAAPPFPSITAFAPSSSTSALAPASSNTFVPPTISEKPTQTTPSAARGKRTPPPPPSATSNSILTHPPI